MPIAFQGLVAATHTPFTANGDLNLAVVESQAARLLQDGVSTVFIGGTTGESHSLTLDERLQLARRWTEVARGSELKAIVHVGSNCLADARTLTRQAAELKAAAVSALAPSYFKPANLAALVASCAHIASAAPQLPFYFYDIPSMTGVTYPMPDFLRDAASAIPNLAGIKFTNIDLMSFQLCREADGGRFDILWGTDEMLLAALAAGGRGAVGSTYNFAAPVYHRLIDAFDRGDLATARQEQLKSIRLVKILVKRGFMASAKALMAMRGVNVGPPRLPTMGLSAEAVHSLRDELEAEGMNPVCGLTAG